MCLNTGTAKNHHFPLVTNGKVVVLGVSILKHFRVYMVPNTSKLHGPSMFAVKSNIYGVLYNQASSIAFNETSSYWSALKSSSDFSAFHWSPRRNLVSIGQHFVITRVVHLPKRTETSLIIESDRFGPIR